MNLIERLRECAKDKAKDIYVPIERTDEWEAADRLEAAEKLIVELVEALQKELDYQYDNYREVAPWINNALIAAVHWKRNRK